jgi:hypothetical protein
MYCISILVQESKGNSARFIIIIIIIDLSSILDSKDGMQLKSLCSYISFVMVLMSDEGVSLLAGGKDGGPKCVCNEELKQNLLPFGSWIKLFFCAKFILLVLW